MPTQVRGLSLYLLLVIVLAGMAHADAPQDLTVHLSMYCPLDLKICSVDPYEQYPGNPAAGHADFSPIDQPWNFTFVTGYPLFWKCYGSCNNYSATFGIGGTFTMDGPRGLTFAGQITSGTAWQNLDLSWGASLSFSGKWSNGLYGYGDLLDQFTDQFGPYASLDVDTVPEPASLALLGAGVLMIWGMRRRRS